MAITKKQNKAGVDTYFLSEQLKVKSRLENEESKLLYQSAILKHPEIESLFFHVANESKSKPQHRHNLKQMGLSSGVSDYLLLMPNDRYHFLTIELKRARKKDSSVNPEQVEFIKNVNKNGGYGCICYGFRAALHVLKLYLSNKL